MRSDELISSVEELKVALLDLCCSSTGADYSNESYSDVRKALTRHPQLAGGLPEWLRRGSSLSEVRGRISQLAGSEAGQWARRREIITRDLDSMIDVLEGSASIAAASLVKLERLGIGGFGEVFRSRRKFIELDFALKILNPSFDEGRDQAMARFFQEARILFLLHHPNIVRVFDVGLMGNRPYMLMELINGQTLGQVGTMSAGRTRNLVSAIASALAHAHERGIVHRDLKPSNIMLETPTERPVLLDFGLGAFVQQEILSRLTRTGQAPAGNSYTAPELHSDPTLLDPRADVYSLGVIWYQSLTGSLPPRRDLESRLEQVPALTATEIELLVACLDDPSLRPTAARLGSLVTETEVAARG